MFTEICTLLQSLLESPLDPLTGTQAWKLQGLPLEGLVMAPDRKSQAEGTHPLCMYARFNGKYIGTAYGSRFVPSSNVMSDEVKGIVTRIEAGYLPVLTGLDKEWDKIQVPKAI